MIDLKPITKRFSKPIQEWLKYYFRHKPEATIIDLVRIKAETLEESFIPIEYHKEFYLFQQIYGKKICIKCKGKGVRKIKVSNLKCCGNTVSGICCKHKGLIYSEITVDCSFCDGAHGAL